MKHYALPLIAALLSPHVALPCGAAPWPERLSRGLIATRTSSGAAMLSWRCLNTDSPDTRFTIYRDHTLLTPATGVGGATCFIDSTAAPGSHTYRVVTGGAGLQTCDKTEQRRSGDLRPPVTDTATTTLAADAPVGYLPIPLNRPDGGTTPDGKPFGYTANDCSVGDVDGDGDYEIILKWEPTNAHDNSHTGYTGPVLLDCYRLDGRRLWRIDLGRNIRAGAHYTQFMVFDLDGDGRAEVVTKTADGTRDGLGRVIGSATADYVCHEADKRQGRILSGPEFITVFSGLTGEALDTQPYTPERGDIAAWGDNYGNRSERYLAAVAFLDGKRPSVVFCRGYYTRTVLAAWDWDGHHLTHHWTFDTDTPEWAAYAGQGNHNIRVADVDGDGCDEIIYGSMAVDHDGRGLYSTGMGHGDAMHLTQFLKDDPRLMLWDCHENRRDGSELRVAATGEVLFKIPSTDDVGRCLAADIDPTNPGLEMWSIDTPGIHNTRGEVIAPRGNLSINFALWWDGDLLRELLNHETITKWDWAAQHVTTLFRFEGCQFNNGTKSNPCLSADIVGDWREEVLTRTADSRELRLYTTPYPTTHRLPCLMTDRVYRLSVAAENVAYNQPPNVGFYLGE